MTGYSTKPSFYIITIANVSGYPKATPNNGFIDNNTIINYAVSESLNLEAGVVSFTLAQSEAKSRANYRYHNLLLQLNRVCNIQVKEITIGENGVRTSTITYGGSPTYNTEPSSISFMVMVEKGDPSLQTWDELNPTVLLTGTAALTRFVVRALCTPPSGTGTTASTDITANVVVYDPTASADAGNTNSLPRYGMRIEPLDIGPVVFGGANVTANYTAAAALVTITQPFTPPAN